MLEDRAATQRDQDRLKKWADINLMEFNKKKNGKVCKSCILGCINKDGASRSRIVIFHPYLALVRPHMECCAQSGQPQHKKEKVQRKPAKIVRGLDHRTCEERLRELVSDQGIQRRWSQITRCLNTGTGCPKTLWNLHPWRCLGLDWT